MSRKLKDWVRLDASGVPVSGSNIRRPKRPVSGKWHQIYPIGCCGPKIAIDNTTSADFPNEAPELQFLCEDVAVVTFGLDIAQNSPNFADQYEAVDWLNQHFGYLGNFYIENGSIQVQVNPEFANWICSDPAEVTAILNDNTI